MIPPTALLYMVNRYGADMGDGTDICANVGDIRLRREGDEGIR